MKYLKKFNESETKDYYNNPTLRHKAWEFANNNFSQEVLDQLFPENGKGGDIESNLNKVKNLGELSKEEWILFIKTVREEGI